MSTEHRPSLNVIDGEALPEHTIVSEAYTHVAEGYRRALTIQGLPLVEVESLTASLRIALSVAGLPPVGRAV